MENHLVIAPNRQILVPIGRLITYLVSIVSLVASLAIGFATYKAKFEDLDQKVMSQAYINEDLKNQIINLRIDVAKLQTAIQNNTEALKNVSKR
jgi:hypothetical protein